MRLAPERFVATRLGGVRSVHDPALDDPQAPAWAAAACPKIAEVGDPRRHVEGLLAIYREAMAM